MQRPNAVAGHQRDIDAEYQALMPENEKKKTELPPWDEFEVIPPEDRGNQEGPLLHIATKIAKYISAAVFGGCVLLGALANKGSLLVLTNAYSQSYADERSCPKTKPLDTTSMGTAAQPYYLRYQAMLMLMVCLLVPEFFTLGYSLYRLIMKKEKDMEWSAFGWGMIPEILHATGLTFLVVKVVPNIDATLAILMFSLVTFAPSAIQVHAKYMSISRNRNRLTNTTIRAIRQRDFAFAITSLIMQLVGYGLLCWQLYTQLPKDSSGKEVLAFAVVSLFFISFRYWENFVSCDWEITRSFRLGFQERQKQLDSCRFKTAALYSIIKMMVIVGLCFLIHFVINENQSLVHGTKTYFRQYRPSAICSSITHSLWNAVITNCLCSLAAFYFGRIACQTNMQVQAYSFPLMLVTPIMATMTSLYTMYGAKIGMRLMDYFSLSVSSQYLNNVVGWKTTLQSGESWQMAVIVVAGLIVGWASLLLLTSFIWKPRQVRLSRTEVLFIKPIYSGILINEDLMLNRRQYQGLYTTRKNREQELERAEEIRKQTNKRGSGRRSTRRSRRLTMNADRRFTPQVFLCATMWHETEQEMTQLLTSIMRLDKDQGERRPNARKDPDFYNFQVHVLFDDAMDVTADGPKPNKFVNMLIDLIPFAANKVELGQGDTLSHPVIYPTPYGGRLEFVLPYGNLFHVHLKDKSKIRHRKRWSQCMYMYYILGYLHKTKKAYKREDVFILALDGDVDFQPKALLLLLDRMKRNPDVGAACGRIHPTGSGPVVWFQKFEYAVGHWLQKTAEHVLGCVLCSPGCFSLFRGEALMDVNVVNMYTTKATEALHYIQWDQGEDRWLCTLLLKQGWRIEYSAASDSFTFAPEEFKEFFNQRRRWGPSTMANVFDILMNAGLTVRNNDYISWGYIAYQMGLMASSILGPATVVLVVQGAFAYVFGMTPVGSLMVALIPVIIFVILCYTTKPDFQLAVAGILTIVYALVMMAVLVGIIGQMTQTLLNPNSIFMLAMIFMYAFTGIIHPTEMLCLLHGLLYYLLVPSAFILLMVYSLCNMNNVSWGTREVRKPVLDAEAQQQALQELAKKNEAKGKSMQIGPTTLYDAQQSTAEGYYSCGLGNLCQCALCINPAPAPPPPPKQPAYQRLATEDPFRRQSMMHRPVTGVDRSEMIRKYSMAKSQFMGQKDRDPGEVERSLSRKMSLHELRFMMANNQDLDDVASLRKSVKRRRDTTRKESASLARAQQLAKEIEEEEGRKINGVTGADSDDDDSIDDVESERLQDEEEEGLYWIVDGPMTDGIIEYLDDQEHEFWKLMINKYLLPLEENKADQARIKDDLIQLRNKMTGAYFLINGLWIVLTFSLTLAIQDINITFYDKNGNEIVLQPLAFLFLIFFLIILVIQFLTMLVHRWSTFVHLMSVTDFGFRTNRYGSKKSKSDSKLENDDSNNNKGRKKKKRNGDQHVEIEEQQEGSQYTHDNQAYESNFSFKGNQTQYDTSRAQTISEGSDIENNYDQLGIGPVSSIRWSNGHHPGMAEALGSAGATSNVEEEPTYSEIGAQQRSNGGKNSLDMNAIFGNQPRDGAQSPDEQDKMDNTAF
ncbi:chitin synthase chs-2-like isoform X2 [Styela clava]